MGDPRELNLNSDNLEIDVQRLAMTLLHAQGCGRLEFIEALKLRDWAEVCSQSQDTRSAVIGGAQNS